MKKHVLIAALIGVNAVPAFAGSYPSGYDPSWPQALYDSGYQDPADLVQRADIQLVTSTSTLRNNLYTNYSYERITVPCSSGYMAAADLGWPSPGVRDNEIQGLSPSQFRVSFEHVGTVVPHRTVSAGFPAGHTR